MFEKIVTFEVALIPILSLEYVTSIQKRLLKILFWFWHRKNDTRLYSYTYTYVFHIKSPIIY